jgi:hypothetical protein
MAVAPVGGGEGVRRGRALPIVAVGAAIVLVVLAAGAYLYDHSRRDLIAAGVRIDGVAVGGLREAAARTKVEHDLVARLNQGVTVRSGGHSWTLDARQAHLQVDVSNMLGQALSASRQGSIVTRTVRGLFGGSVNRDVPLVVSYSHQAVRNLTASGPRGRQPGAAGRDRAAERERPERSARAARPERRQHEAGGADRPRADRRSQPAAG